MTEKRYYLEDYKDFTRITLRLYDNKIEHKHYDWLSDCNNIVDLLNEQDKEIILLTRKLTDTIRYNEQLIHLIEDYCEKHYDDLHLQSKIDFGKILKHLGWEVTDV